MATTAEQHHQKAAAAINDAQAAVRELEEQITQARLYRARMIQMGRDHGLTWSEIAHEAGSSGASSVRSLWIPYLGLDGMPPNMRDDKGNRCPVCTGTKVQA